MSLLTLHSRTTAQAAPRTFNTSQVTSERPYARRLAQVASGKSTYLHAPTNATSKPSHGVPHSTAANTLYGGILGASSFGFGARSASRAQVSALAAHPAAGDTSDSTADYSSLSGPLAAEFGPRAWKVLHGAAAAAAAAAEKRSSATDDPSSAPGGGTSESPVVLVTEQHLLSALLQQHPGARKVLDQHVIPSQEHSRDAQHSASKSKVGQADAVADSCGSNAVTGAAEIMAAPHIQLSSLLLSALNKALTITRQKGAPAVLWPSMLWGLMRITDAHTAYQHILGGKILSGDAVRELQHIVAQQSCKTDPELAEHYAEYHYVSDSSWLDQTLDLALADAKSASADQRHLDAATQLTSAINSAATVAYQPHTVWLKRAWECIETACEKLHDWSLQGELSVLCPAVVTAAYCSITSFEFADASMCDAFKRMLHNAIARESIVGILPFQALVVANALPDSRAKACIKQLRQNPAIANSLTDKLPSEILTHLCRVLLEQKQLARGLPFTGNIVLQYLSQVQTIPKWQLSHLYQLVDSAPAPQNDSSSSEAVPWSDSWANSMERLFSMVDENVSTLQLLNIYTGVFTSADNLSAEKQQLLQLMLERIQQRQHRAQPWLQQAYAQILAAQGEATIEGLGVLSALALGNDIAGFTSAQHTKAYLRTSVSQMIDGQQAQQSADSAAAPVNMFGSCYQLLPELLLDLVQNALIPRESTATQPAITRDKSTGALCHLCTVLSAVESSEDMMDQLMAMMPELLLRLESKPAVHDHGTKLVVQQQLQLGMHTGGLKFSKSMSARLLRPIASTAASGAAVKPGTDQAMPQAYCTNGLGPGDIDRKAAAAAETLKMTEKSDLRLSAQQLVDMAQALGASKLPVESAVMDVLAHHVGRTVESFTVMQLPVLLWAFALKPPSLGLSKHVLEGLADRVLVCKYSELGHEKEAAVVAWTLRRLAGLGLIDVQPDKLPTG